jgi:carbon-monoxide dehydrogenase small subunit/xanthine dehydrogenase YagT iron-sulfur-binding subunit
MRAAERSLVVNGEAHSRPEDVGMSLLHFLREHLRLTGTKEACGSGECGACTVLIEGKPQLSCITLSARVTQPVTTIEGLAHESADIAAAFAAHGGFQCGFCTSGQIVHATAILREGLPLTRKEAEAKLRHELSGNICRCTGYVGIVNAILAVAEQRRKIAETSGFKAP